MDRKWQMVGVVALALLILACGSTAGTGGGQTIIPAATSAPTGDTAAPTEVAEVPTTAPEPTAEPPTAAPAAQTAKVGDRIEQNGTALTVVKVERQAKIGDFQEAKAGNTFVLVEVLLENIGQETIPYNLFYFELKDSEGFESNTTIYTGDGGFSSGDLPPGDKVRGIVAFEVKESATGLILSYQPITFGADDPIRVALE